MKGVLLLCERMQDAPHIEVAGRVEQCAECRIEVWVPDSGRAALEPGARAHGVDVTIVCLSCGQRLLGEAETEGHANEQVAQTPDQLRDSFERRMQVIRRGRQ